MLKKLTSALLLGAMLVFGAQAALAQNPVILDIGTSTGNDTLNVGIPGSIIWSADANGNSCQGIVWAYVVSFSAGNWIGTMQDADGAAANTVDTNVFPSANTSAIFASRAWNPNYGQGTDPDTILYGLTSFGGPWTISDESFRVDVTPSGAGDAIFHGVVPPDQPLPPANFLSVQDPTGADLPIQFEQDKLIACVVKPNVVPSCTLGVTQSATTIVFGNPINGQIFGSDEDGTPQPLSYYLVSAVNSAGTGPINAFNVNAATGAWDWLSAVDGPNTDVGTWTVTFGVTDGLDSATCDPITFDVIAEQPLVCFAFGCVEAYSGMDICVPLYLDNLLNPCKELGGFDLLFQYDASLLTFTGIDLTGSVLETSGWEYLTYRLVSSNPAKIRIVAIADMNNSNQHPNEYCIDGLLANLCFRTTNDRNLACQSAWLYWCWDDCGDNTASSKDGNDLFIVADPANGPWVGGNINANPPVPGGGIINACHDSVADVQLFTGQGGLGGPAGHPCPNPDTTKPDPIECLYFVNGKIKIKCPGDIDDRGDINLNGLAYEIADAVLYSNYFIQGPSVFGNPADVTTQAKIAASDINADGTPLTVADLVYLIRVITGDAEPIAEDLLGGGPKVAASVGKLNVEALEQGAITTIKARSDLDMGAGLFTFNYSATEITDVKVLGRASDMTVDFQAENGELRVLVFNIEDGHKVAAGHGEILQVVTTGGGELELVEVEAASFMGGVLESNVTAKVLPTQFALKQNYPNPFNPTTSLAIDFPQAADYKLTIYNIAGQTVKTYSGATEAGTLTLVWDGTDKLGGQVATGVYFYSVEAGAFKDVKKMVLLK